MKLVTVIVSLAFVSLLINVPVQLFVNKFEKMATMINIGSLAVIGLTFAAVGVIHWADMLTDPK